MTENITANGLESGDSGRRLGLDGQTEHSGGAIALPGFSQPVHLPATHFWPALIEPTRVTAQVTQRPSENALRFTEFFYLIFNIFSVYLCGFSVQFCDLSGYLTI